MGNHGRCKGGLLGTVRESLKVEARGQCSAEFHDLEREGHAHFRAIVTIV